MSLRQKLLDSVPAHNDALIALCSRLTATDSQNPPGDTTKIAAVCAEFLGKIPGVETEIVTGKAPMANVVARLKGAKPGRRLIFNGHLDTGLIPQPERWTVPPLGGVIKDGRIYGRGVADMRAGLATSMVTLAALAPYRDALSGEIVLTLVADEGTGAKWGALHVLDHVPHAIGDAMISGDVGSPRVARFGEKGFLWLEIVAEGKAAGGAHTYLGINAVERLMAALPHVLALADHGFQLSPAIARAIDSAGPVSEAMHGKGETNALKSITVNIGIIEGGKRINAVPSVASARIDIRFPPGVTAAALVSEVTEKLSDQPWIKVNVLDQAEPNWTEPDAEIVRLIEKNAGAVMGKLPALSIRLGFSDARHYRERGVPCVGFGATAHNGNAPDEYIETADLAVMLKTYTLTAFDFLDST